MHALKRRHIRIAIKVMKALETEYRFKTICWMVTIVFQSTATATGPEEIVLRGDGGGVSASGSGTIIEDIGIVSDVVFLCCVF